METHSTSTVGSASGPVLAIDYGEKHLGAALGQPLTQQAKPLKRLARPRRDHQWRILDKLVADWAPAAFVVGLPLNMDGTDQAVTGRARAFARELESRYERPVHLHDERLSTREARERALDAGHDPDQNDAFAAAVIAEGWLAANAR